MARIHLLVVSPPETDLTHALRSKAEQQAKEREDCERNAEHDSHNCNTSGHFMLLKIALRESTAQEQWHTQQSKADTALFGGN